MQANDQQRVEVAALGGRLTLGGVAKAVLGTLLCGVGLHDWERHGSAVHQVHSRECRRCDRFEVADLVRFRWGCIKRGTWPRVRVR